MDLLTVALAKSLANQYTDEKVAEIQSYHSHICSSSEYSNLTGVPTISSPDETTFYFTPDISGEDIFHIYVYQNNAWSLFGSCNLDPDDFKVNWSEIIDKPSIDSTPTANSTNLVTSGGVAASLTSLSGDLNKIMNPQIVPGDVELDNVPNVPSWALQSDKPSYTASEIGSTNSTVQDDINTLTTVVSDKIDCDDNLADYFDTLSGTATLDVDVSEDVEQAIRQSTELAETIISNSETESGSFSVTGLDPQIQTTISNLVQDVSDLEDEKVPFPTSSQYGTSGQILSTLGDGTTQWVNANEPSASDVATAVTAWLAEHPEATTSVADHSLTYAKLVNGTLNFVTPEMYEAVGDGETDDTTAIQNAITNGDYILFAKKTYKVTQTINITHGDIIIDFNGADIVCTANNFIKAVAAFDTTLYTGAYTANSAYGYGTGDGLVNIVSTETAHYGRLYYYKGGTYYSVDDHLNGVMPYSIASCTMKGQSAPLKNITIKNLGSYTNNNMVAFNSSGIKFSGVCDSVIENCRLAPINHNYIGVEIVSCSNITVRDCIIELIDTTNNNTYGISFGDSSYTTIERCRIYSAQWDCITTGGGGTSNHVLVTDCILHVSSLAASARAYDDHANSLGVKIAHCKIIGDVAISDGLVEDCEINPRSGSIARCNFQAWVGNAVKPNATFRDIRTNAGTIYFVVSYDIQNGTGSDLTMQIGTMSISNIRGNALISARDSTLPSSITSINYENLIVEGVTASMNLLQVFKNIKISNSKITSMYFNATDYDARLSHTPKIMMTNCVSVAIQNGAFGIDVQADNCEFNDFFNYGSVLPSNVQLSNCRNTKTTAVTIKASKLFQLFNCVFECPSLSLANSTGEVKGHGLSSIASGVSSFPYGVYKAANANIYYQQLTPVEQWTSVSI